MEQLVIEGGHPLRGTVRPAGNKNAALPLLAGCLLTAEPVVLHNLPVIRDVKAMRRLLEDLGTTVAEIGPGSWRLTTPTIGKAELNPELCQAIRASILLAGPVLARTGQVELPPPGGDVIGRRRLDTHFLALTALGAAIECGERFCLSADRLRGADILLDECSVTATENAVMAAVLARGTTCLRNAASEPHVQQLCRFLNGLGARISGVGSNVLTIEGVETLHGGEFTVGPDYLEVVSFIGAAAVTGGSITIKDASPEDLAMIALNFRRIGVEWGTEGADIVVAADQSLQVVADFGGAFPEIKTNTWPGFPTDLISIAITVATQAAGTVLFHDFMYHARMYFTDKLVGMGAKIVLCDPHRCIVQGPTRLHGARLESPDIRAGMSLLLAALCAEGTSVIGNIGQIERGYERIDEKLRALGAHIERQGIR